MMTKKFQITRLEPWSIARLNSLIVGTFSVLTVLLQIVLGTYSFLKGEEISVSYWQFLGGVVLEGIFTIISGFVVGLIIGLVVSVVYNWWAHYVGGMKIDLNELE